MIVPSMLTEPNAGQAPFRSGRRIFPLQSTVSPIAPPPPDPPVSRPPPIAPCERLTIPPIHSSTGSMVAATITSPSSTKASVTPPGNERWTRVTNNVRNTSSDVWNYDPALGFNDGKEPFEMPPAVELERQRRLGERTKKEHFWLARQNHWQQLDAARWERLCLAEDKAAQLLALKRSRSKMGSSSVSYDVLTSGYCNGPQGESLKKKDSAMWEKLTQRSEFLRTKLNTYNPIQGQDLVPLSDEDKKLMPRNSVRRCK